MANRPTVVIELTSDEERLLDGFRRAQAADADLRAGLAKTGVEVDETGKAMVNAMLGAGKATTITTDKIVRQLKSTGAEGREMAAAVSKHLQDTGKHGRQSVDGLLKKLQSVDSEAAEVAGKVAAELKSASDKSTFAQTLAHLKALGPAGNLVAGQIAAEMETADAKIGFSQAIAKLRSLGDEGAQTADRIVREMETADRKTKFESALMELGHLGQAGQEAAREITESLQSADAKVKFDKAVEELKLLGPEGQLQADRIFVAMDRADSRIQFQNLLGSLREISSEGETVAARIEQELKFAADKSALDFEGVLAKISELKPEAAEVAKEVQRELSEAAKFSEGRFAATLDELRKLGPAGQTVARELKTHLASAGEIMEKDIDDVIKKLRAIDPAAADAAEAINRNLGGAANKSDLSFKSFGKNALTQLAGVAGAYVGVHEAIQKVIELNREVLQTNKEAFGSIEKTESGDKRLLQVSKSGADFQRLRSNADNLSKDFGIDREASRQLVFSARSEGFEGSLDFIGRNAQVIDVDAQARVAGQIPELFKSSGQRVTPEQAINATLAAANESRLGFEEIARALPSAAEGSALVKSSASETTAALSVLASRFKSGDVAGDRIKAFATKASLNERLDDRGLLGTVAALQQFSPKDRKKFLGDSEQLNTAYQFLSEEFNTIRQRQKITERAIRSTGTDFSPTAVRVQAANNDPRLQSLLSVRRSEIELEIAREKRRATTEGKRQAFTNKELTRAEVEGVAGFQIEAAEQLGEFVAGWDGDSAEAVALATDNKLANLERDFRTAFRQGDESVSPALLATHKLRQLRRSDLDALLSADATAEFIRGSTGEFISPIHISNLQRSSLTEAIDRQAGETAGFGRTLSESVFRGYEGTDVPFLGSAARAAAEDGSTASREIIAELKRNNELLEESNSFQRQTASNTKPNPRRPTDATRDAARAADGRRAR